MEVRQRDHIALVVDAVSEGFGPPRTLSHDDHIVASWQRCVHQHGLEAVRMQDAVILSSYELREHRQRLEEFLYVARHELRSLYQQIAGAGYCILFTDARGVTVDFMGDGNFNAELRSAGLYLGANWSEAHAGTNGIGTSIAIGQPITLHQDDHFDATHISLTCSASPVFDVDGSLLGILDISALNSPQSKHSQYLALQLTKVAAQRLENVHFHHRYRQDWVIRLNGDSMGLDASPDMLLALDADGRVVGHNRMAQLRFGQRRAGGILGVLVDDILEMPASDLASFVMPGQGPLVELATGQPLLAQARPPAGASATRQGVVRYPQQEKLSSLGTIEVGMSHGLNTPLGNNKLALSTLRDRLIEVKSSYADGSLTRRQIESFLDEGMRIADLANSAADRAIGLVESFKQVSAEQASWDLRQFDLAALVREVIDALRPSYASQPWQFSAQVPEGLLMHGYPDALAEIVVGLVRNSIQHGFQDRSHGSVAISGRREPAADGEPPWVVLAVSDDGAGIAPDVIDRIFEPFFTTKLGRDCAGLGLTVANRMVTTLFGGELAAESRPGTGTTIRIRIPADVRNAGADA